MIPKVIQDDADALLVWNRLQGQLSDAGKWKPEYVDYFAVLVLSIAGLYRTCETLRDTDTSEILVNPRKGTSYRNPLLDIKAQHINVINRFGSAFGLNPLADAKLKTAGTDGIGELLKLMAGPEV